MLSFVVSFVKDSRTARLPMNPATDACMFGVDADPFFWGTFPIKRYVHSFVVVFLFRGNLCLSVERKERNVDDDEKDELVSVVAQIEKVDDTNESENREEEKNIARKIESFGGDGFIVIIIFFFFFSCSSKTSSSKQKRGVVLWRYKRPPNDGRSVLKVDVIITIIIERRLPVGTKTDENCPQELEPIGRERRRRRF